jgi:hypothetical protein
MRHIIATALLAAALLVSAACSTADTSNAGAASDDKVVSNTGNKEHPPAADVKLRSCKVDEYGLVRARLAVTNHSSKASDYVISVEVLDGSGTRVGEAGAFVTALRPGKSARTDAAGDAGGEDSITCKVTQVERLSSEG